MGIGEEAAGDHSKEKAADVCEIGDAAGAHLGDGAEVEKLDEEPEADQERCRDKGYAKEDKKEEHGANAVAGKRNDEGSHDSGDGSAGAEAGDGGAGSGGDLREHSDEASQKVERGETPMVHGVFHGLPLPQLPELLRQVR